MLPFIDGETKNGAPLYHSATTAAWPHHMGSTGRFLGPGKRLLSDKDHESLASRLHGERLQN